VCGTGWSRVTDSREHGTEFSGSIKEGEFVD
jgi:hypothetical protein